jgi:hypothetical protein
MEGSFNQWTMVDVLKNEMLIWVGINKTTFCVILCLDILVIFNAQQKQFTYPIAKFNIKSVSCSGAEILLHPKTLPWIHKPICFKP